MLQLANDPDLAISEAAAAQVAVSIATIDRDAWNACFPGEVEDYDCLLAIEEAGIAGFEWRYITVFEDGRLRAAMPAFLCPYMLDTTLEEGAVRRLVRRVRQWYPKFLTLRLACLGSPCTENGVVGFYPDVPSQQRETLFVTLLQAFEKHAAAEKCQLMGLKDFAKPIADHIVRPLSARGYATMNGLPTAWLDIDFETIDAYMARLSSSTRKDMRRKLKSAEKVRIEMTNDVGALLTQIMPLYHDTRSRSEWQFEELTSAYFAGILTHMPRRSFCNLYFVDDRLLAANLLVHDGHRLIDKFFCMDGDAGRRYNLYFLSWFTNLRHCIDHGMRRYQSGQAYYENKLRLGSQLTHNAMFFRHRNRLTQAALRLVSPFLSASEETLR
jgi:predicted N-acyltransferase